MSSGNSIQFSFGADLAPLKRDVMEAERIGSAGAARVATAMNAAAAAANRRATGFGNANPAGFGVPFGMSRAQRNSSSGYAPARAGQYPAPQEEGGGSSRSLRSVGAFTAVYGARRAINFWEELYAAELKIRDNIQKLTAISGPFGRSSGDIHSNLSGIASQIEEIQQRSREELQGGVGGKANTPTGTVMRLYRKGRQFLTNDSDAQETERIGVLHAKAAEDLGDMARNQEKLNLATALGNVGREREAELLKESVRFEEKLRALAALEVSVGQYGQTPADRAAITEHNLNVGTINQTAAASANQAREDQKRKQAELNEQQFQTFQQVNGDWSGYKEQQRDDKHARAVFDARKRDYAQRRANGAYGQTGPDAEAFGSNGQTEWVQKIYEIMVETWRKN